jgi:hypothetical protein
VSAEAVGYVYRHSPYEGATFQVHLAIADSVNDQNRNEFFMRLHRLADKARVTRQSVSRAVGRLLEDAFLVMVAEGGGRGRPARYRFAFPECSVVFDSRSETVTADDSKRASRGVGKPVTRSPAGAETVKRGDSLSADTVTRADSIEAETVTPHDGLEPQTVNVGSPKLSPTVPQEPKEEPKELTGSSNPPETRDRDDASGVIAHYVDAFGARFGSERAPTDIGELASLVANELKAGWPVELCKRAAAAAAGDEFGARAFRKHLRRLGGANGQARVSKAARADYDREDYAEASW